MAESVSLNNVIIKDVISFSVYGANTLNNVVNATVLGIFSGDSLSDPLTAAVNTQNIFPSIPTNSTSPVTNDYRSYTYFKLRLSDNSVVEYAKEWIIPVTLTRLVRGTANVIISDVDNSQIGSLRSLLIENGYTVNNISFS